MPVIVAFGNGVQSKSLVNVVPEINGAAMVCVDKVVEQFLESLTIIVYAPGTKLLKVLLVWYVLPLFIL